MISYKLVSIQRKVRMRRGQALRFSYLLFCLFKLQQNGTCFSLTHFQITLASEYRMGRIITPTSKMQQVRTGENSNNPALTVCPDWGVLVNPATFFVSPITNFQWLEGDKEKGAPSAPFPIFLGSLSGVSSMHLTVTTAASRTLFLCRAHQCR